MYLPHLPQALLLFLNLTLARPEPRSNQISLLPNRQCITLDPRSPEARQQRLEAWKAQKPMHTTALLAGAAATAVPGSRSRDGKQRDSGCVMGEKALWIPDEFWDDGDEVGGERGPREGDVRGEKVAERVWEIELEDEDEEMKTSLYGMKDVLAPVWRKLEEIGLVVQRKKQQIEDADELDDGHDGDL